MNHSDNKKFQKLRKIYFLGIGGTGMSSVAGLCQEAGYDVSGSDSGIYPPTSTMLEHLKIPYLTPYNPQNILREKPELVVIANVLSRGNAELEQVLADGLPYTSFPKLLGDFFLNKRISCVVAGTHGKTTTTALLAHVLRELGEDPGFLIGGLPKTSEQSFFLGKGQTFVIEGDEYDTAFFDKGPKFLHYHPKHLILNNIEFDHADIYQDLEAILSAFAKLLALVPDPRLIVANCDDPGVCQLLDRSGLAHKVTLCSTLGLSPSARVRVHDVKPCPLKDQDSVPVWQGTVTSDRFGPLFITTPLTGRHNFSNIGQVIACLINLEECGHLKMPLEKKTLLSAFLSFSPPKRRLDLLGKIGNTLIFEDFAHHPTAVQLVLESLKLMFPDKKLTVAFEPRSATNRRNVFHTQYVKSLSVADSVLIGEVLRDQRIPEHLRFNPEKLASDIGPHAKSFEKNEALLAHLKKTLDHHDIIVFMSSGSFSGIQHNILK